MVQRRNVLQVLQREGTMVTEKGEREISTQENVHKCLPKTLAWKMREADFHEFWQPALLTSWSIKGQEF